MQAADTLFTHAQTSGGGQRARDLYLPVRWVANKIGTARCCATRSIEAVVPELFVAGALLVH